MKSRYEFNNEIIGMTKMRTVNVARVAAGAPEQNLGEIGQVDQNLTINTRPVCLGEKNLFINLVCFLQLHRVFSGIFSFLAVKLEKRPKETPKISKISKLA